MPLTKDTSTTDFKTLKDSVIDNGQTLVNKSTYLTID